MRNNTPKPVIIVQLTDRARTDLLRRHLLDAGLHCPEIPDRGTDVLLIDANWRGTQPAGDMPRVVLSLGPSPAAAYQLPVEANPGQVVLAVQMAAEIARLRVSLELAQHVGDQLADEALRDALTGIGNRRAWDQWLDKQLESTTVSDLCVALVDLDHFKQINDRFGHPLGDQVLRWVATAIGKATRKHDFVARLGGDEFIVGLVDVPDDALPSTIERVRREVAQAVEDVLPQQLSASVGYVPFQVLNESQRQLARSEQAKLLYTQADLALHAAKGAGRDQSRSAAE